MDNECDRDPQCRWNTRFGSITNFGRMLLGSDLRIATQLCCENKRNLPNARYNSSETQRFIAVRALW